MSREGGPVSWMECTFRTARTILRQREFHQDLQLQQQFDIFVLGLFRCTAIDAFLGPELVQVASTMSHFLSTVGAVEYVSIPRFPLGLFGTRCTVMIFDDHREFELLIAKHGHT